jgi:hypothetical protein
MSTIAKNKSRSSLVTAAPRNTAGALFYDGDGSGLGDAQVQFATLNPGLAIATDDFLVV